MSIRRTVERARAKQLAGLIAIALAGAALTACDSSTKPSEPVVLDQRLARIYEASCATCHTVPDTGAPQSHDVDAWAPRMAQDDDTLLDHMANGFNGMPPLGQCFECSGEDLTVLAHFMAAPAPIRETEKTITKEEASPQGDVQEGIAP